MESPGSNQQDNSRNVSSQASSYSNTPNSSVANQEQAYTNPNQSTQPYNTLGKEAPPLSTPPSSTNSPVSSGSIYGDAAQAPAQAEEPAQGDIPVIQTASQEQDFTQVQPEPVQQQQQSPRNTQQANLQDAGFSPAIQNSQIQSGTNNTGKLGSAMRFSKQFAGIAVGFCFGLLGGFILLTSNNNSSNEPSGQVDVSYHVKNINLSQLAEGEDQAIPLALSKTLAINGQLKANNGLVITPGSQPENPQTGQLYYDNELNELRVYDGTAFTSLAQTGQPGPQGPAGPAGADGQDGTDGQDGANGIDGENGCLEGECVSLQSSTPGTIENGHINISGSVIAGSLQGNGANITSLNASNIASGTLADGRLSPNVPLLNSSNTFTSSNIFSGDLTVDSNTFFVDSTNNQVGLGTLSPNETLTIAGAASFAELSSTPGTTSGFGKLYVKDSDGKLYFKDDAGNEFDLTATGGGGTITGSGNTGQATFWTGSSTVSGSNSFFWDNANSRLGIGTTTPSTALDVSGATTTDNLTVDGNTALGDALSDTVTFNGTIQGTNALTFEGSSVDGNETTFAITNPTADQTITFPNATGEVSLLGQTIGNSELENTSVTYGGVTVALGGSDPTPDFDLTDGFNLPIVGGTTGTLTTARGGTGATSFTTNGVLYGNGVGAIQSTSAPTAGQVLIANATGVPTFATLSGDVTVNDSGVTTIGADTVALGTDTTGNYVATVTTGNGLNVTGVGSESATANIDLSIQASKGLEADGNGLSLIDCAANEILKYNGSNAWACSADDGANTTFTLSGDSGSDQLLADGDTIEIAGGQGLSSIASAVDTLTLDIGAGTGIQVNADTIEVLYGSSAGTAVEGDTQITVAAGNDLAGGGSLTLGTGGTVTLNTVENPTFATSVTTPLLTNASANLQLTTTTSGNIVLNSAGTIELQDNTNLTGSLVATGNATFDGGSFTVGADSQAGTFTIYDGGTGAGSHTGIFQVASGLTQNTTYTFPDPGQATASVCLTTGNCAGAGGGVTTGGGTTNRLAKFTSSNNIENSSISDDGSTVTLNGSDLIIQGGVATVGTSSQAGLLVLNDSSSNTGSLQTAALGSNRTYIFPDADGTVCLTSGNCTGGGGGSAPHDAAYLTLSLDADLSSERVATAGDNITFNDSGANGNLTIATTQDPTFTTSVTTPIVQNAGLTLSSTGTNSLSLNTNGTERLFIESGGEIGIGTTTPDGLLNLYKDSINAELLRLSRNGANYVSFLAPSGSPSILKVQGAGTDSFGIATTSAGDLSVGDVNFYQDVLVANGRLGVGTTTPGTDLDVVGTTTTDTLDVDANATLGDASTDTLTINAVIQGTNPLVFEGTTADGFETTLTLTDPTVDRTVTLPDASGEVTLLGQTIGNSELENNTVNYGGVTVALGGSDLTPAFDLTDSTSLPIVGGTTGTLSVARGGTGNTTLTSNGVLYGNGTSAIQTTAAPGAGQVLLGNTSGVPVFTTLSGDIAVDGTGATTIQANSVALGTDTTGNYVATIAGSSHINVDGSGTETAAVSLDIISDSLDFTEFADSLSLDSTTTLALGANNFQLNLDSTGDFVLQDAGVNQHIFHDNGDVEFDVADDTFFVDASSNRVGIGTNSPGELLDVAGNIKTGLGYVEKHITWPGTNAESYLLIGPIDTNGRALTGIFTGARSSSSSSMTTVQARVNFKTANGNTSFHASADIMDQALSLSDVRLFTVDYDGKQWLALRFTGSIAHHQPHNMAFRGNADNVEITAVSSASVTNVVAYTGDGKHIFETGTVGFAGNVGIGTASPTNTLHVKKDVDDYVAHIENDGDTAAAGGLLIDTRWNVAGNYPLKITSNSGSKEILAVEGTGNVGIGTTSPGSILDILQSTDSSTGGVRVRNGTGSIALWNGTSNAVLETLTNTGLELRANGANNNDQLFLATSGNVGIGTTIPGASLQVNSSDGNIIRLSRSGHNTFGLELVNSDRFRIQDITSGREIISALFSNGNVGIGTANPAHKLQVADGNILLDNTRDLIWKDLSGTEQVVLQLHSDNKTYLDGPSGLALRTSGTERITVLSGGNVGIGTTSPGALLTLSKAGDRHLELAGSLGSTNSKFIEIRNNEDGLTNRYIIRGFEDYDNNGAGQAEVFNINTDGGAFFNGNVGIGTTSPETKLDIQGGTANLSALLLGNNTYYGAETTAGTNIRLLGIDTANNVYLGALDNAGGSVFIREDGSNLIALNDGNVGIGITNPDTKLEVEGGVKIRSTNKLSFTNTADQTFIHAPGTNLLALGTNSTERVRINADGNVGIGDSTPDAKLDIVGDHVRIEHSDQEGIRFNYAGAASGGEQSIGSNSNGDLILSAHSSLSTNEHLLIQQSTGNVGIGVTNPSSFKLQSAGHVGPDVASTYDLGSASLPWRTLYADTVDAGTITTNLSQGSVVFADASGNLSQDNANFFWDDTNNRLGIGTGSPNYQLHQETTGTTLTHNLKIDAAAAAGNYGEIAFQTWSGAGSGLNTFGGAGTSRPSVVLRGLSEDSAARGAFVVATFGGGADNTALTEKFRITSAGNVGIGTANPTDDLEVQSPSGSDARIHIDTTDANSATADAVLELAEAGVTKWQIYNDGDNSDKLRFGSAVTIEQAGNVGIGTTSPDAKLHIATGSGGGSDTTSTALLFNNTYDNTGSPFPNKQVFWQSSTDTSGDKFGIGVSTADLDFFSQNDFRFHRYASGTVTEDLLVIEQNGNVGIGTTSPGERLVVGTGLGNEQVLIDGGTTTGVDEASIIFSQGGSNGFTFGYDPGGSSGSRELVISDGSSVLSNQLVTFKQSGNVGIGTTGPDSKLEIQAGSNDGIYLENTAGTDVAQLRVENSDAGYLRLFDGGTETVRFSGDSSGSSYINGGGNVGIGTTSPNARLSIYQDTGLAGDLLHLRDHTDTADLFVRYDGSSAWQFRTEAAGGGSNPLTLSGDNVGVGTASPDAKLDVENTSGSEFVRLSDSTNAASTGIYSGAGSPEGVVTANIGSIYTDNANGRVYRKATGSGSNTGWEELTSGGGSTHMAKMTRDAAQSIPTNSFTKISFDTEEYDVGGIADFSTNDRFDIKKAGKYLITASWHIGNLDDIEIMVAAIYKNGVKVHEDRVRQSVNDLDMGISTTETLDLAVGDYIEFYVWHNEGASQNTQTAVDTKPKMSVIQLDGGGGETSPQYVRAYHNTSQSTGNGSTTYLSFNSEIVDTNNLHDTSTNNGRLTAQEEGMYVISCNISFVSNGTGRRGAAIRLNATDIIAFDQRGAVDNGDVSISTMYKLSKDDYVECGAFQTSGGPLDVQSNAPNSPGFSMTKVDGGKLSDLQTAYNLGNEITLTDARDFKISAADTATDSNIIFDLLGAGAFKVQDSSADVFSIQGDGTAFFKSSTNSTTALQVQDASANVVFNVDTVNQRVGIGTDSPRGRFDVDGSGDIYLADDTVTGTTQSVFIAGHTFLTPYNGTDISYLQARRSDSSGSTQLQLRTYNSGSIVEALRIDNTGKVGIGTTNPDYALEVAHATSDAHIRINAANGNDAYLRLTEESTSDFGGMLKYNGGTNIFQIGTLDTGAQTAAIFIPRASQSVGIATSSPGTYKLAVQQDSSSSAEGIRLLNAAGDKTLQAWVGTGGAVLDAEGTTNLHLRTGGADRLFIDNSSGTVGIGTVTPNSSYSLDVIGDAGVTRLHAHGGLEPAANNALILGSSVSGRAAIATRGSSTGSRTHLIFENPNGQVGSIVTSGSGTAYNETSDQRLKDNIVTTANGLDLLLDIPVRDFNFKADPSKKVQGFIAQELYNYYPNAVTVGGDDPKKNPWAVDYGRLTPLIMKSLQDFNSVVDVSEAPLNSKAILIDNAGDVTINNKLIAQDLNISGNATVNNLKVTDTLTTKKLVVTETLETADIYVNGHIVGSTDVSGEVAVPSGQTKAEFSFAEPYGSEPSVVITPKQKMDGVEHWIEANEAGFTLHLSEAPATEMKFNYLIIGREVQP